MTSLMLQSTELTMPQFQTISQMVKELAGINLHLGKKELVRARLSKRLRLLGISEFDEYLEYLSNHREEEIVAMLDVLSTNLTYFFREPRHFRILKDQVIPQMMRRHHSDRKMRLWSAGCSSGEEPYSMAIVLRETIQDFASWNIKILGTDLSSEMLHIARSGIYSPNRLREMSSKAIQKNFSRIQRSETRLFQVREPIKNMADFARLNLMGPWPMRGPFDVIFCRNVMIYFDKPTQQKLVERLFEMLTPEGILFIGHSESLAGVSHRFQYIEPTVYRKP